jgi:DNA-binding transcriptional ArsR family regulator
MRPARDTDIFDAVAHPVRRRILMRLKTGEQNAGDLAAPFSMSLAAVAQHLAVLREAELVRAERRGRNIYYLLDPRPLQAIFEWVDDFADAWNAKLDALEAHLDANPELPPPTKGRKKAGLSAARSARASTARTPRRARGRSKRS